MIFGKKTQQQTRGFQYKPRFWNEKEEEFRNRIADAERRYHGESSTEYTPSKNFNFRGGSTSGGGRNPRFETNYGKVNPWRLIILIALLSAVAYFMLYR